MELIQYIRLFRKWLWLILLAAFVTGGISFIINTGLPSVYDAQVTLAIGTVLEDPNPNAGTIGVAERLAPTYAQLVRTFDILQATIDELGLPMSPEELRGAITTRILSNTSLLVLTVTHPDPVVAADTANGLANQLIQQSPANLTLEQQQQLDFSVEQVSLLNQQLQDARLQLEAIDSQIETTTNETEINRLTEQRNATLNQINQASSTIAEFNTAITELQLRTGSIEIVERARIPSSARGTNVINITLLGTAVGAVLAIMVALVMEYLDDTIRTTEQAAQVLALPVLGAILRFGKKEAKYSDRLITRMPSMSPVVESYRTLRTNLLFASRNRRKAVYVVTSSGPEEGKSVTSANLAITMAQAGLQVLLIDADLRRPRVHEIFSLENKVGLTTLLFADPGQANDDNGGVIDGDETQLPTNLKQCLQNTTVPRLRVITSGFIPSNPTEILGSALMERWVEVFRSSANIDVVLIDSPPCLLVADSAVLAVTAKAEVLLVVDGGHTRRGAALKAKERFASLGVDIKGVIVNRINPREESYDYGYEHSYYYATTAKNQQANGAAKHGIRLFGRRKEKQ
jgi:Mrp family chromosome partitioning ATPase/capsular polysaccharide biosynthesis protein